MLEHGVADDGGRPHAECVFPLPVEPVGIAVDVEEDLLEDVVRVGPGGVATQASDDLLEEVVAGQLVEEPEGGPAAGVAVHLHEACREDIPLRLEGALPVAQHRHQHLGIELLALLGDLPAHLGEPAGEALGVRDPHPIADREPLERTHGRPSMREARVAGLVMRGGGAGQARGEPGFF